MSTDRFVGQRQRRGLTDAAVDGGDVEHRLPGDQTITGAHGVAQADLGGIELAGQRESVHLRFVGETGLDHAESAHRTARQVVGAHCVAVDHRVGAPVRALGVRDGVDQHR